jgi:transcription termination/antitermination protein NusG
VSTTDEKSASDPRWYAIRVQSNKEDSVKRNIDRKIELRGLQDRIREVVVPTEKVAEIRNGKKRTRAVKTYPGYVLAHMVMDEDTWVFIRETPGVGDFVGASAMPARGGAATPKPFPLRPEEVQKIFGTAVGEAGGTAKIKINFQTGDKVKIKEGPFENFDGVVDDINEQKGIVRVIVTIFGRATPVELQYWQVETL